MTTSPFFQQQDYYEEQRLIEDLLIEAIQIHGFDCYYLPRRRYSVDGILLEDTQNYFDTAMPFEVYLKNADQFGGERTFLSNFGIEVRDRITLVAARRRFKEVIGDELNMERPLEGDMIYFTTNGRLFEVRYVERYSMLYPLGTLPTWELQCELIEAVSQRMETGIAAIDAFEQLTTQDMFRFNIRTAGGQPIRTAEGDLWLIDGKMANGQIVSNDPLDQSANVSSESPTILNFDETDPFAEGPFK